MRSEINPSNLQIEWLTFYDTGERIQDCGTVHLSKADELQDARCLASIESIRVKQDYWQPESSVVLFASRMRKLLSKLCELRGKTLRLGNCQMERIESARLNGRVRGRVGLIGVV